MGKYTAYIQPKYTRIGCEYHSNEEWLSFSDEEIDEMDTGALDYWCEAKPLIAAAMDVLKKEEKANDKN